WRFLACALGKTTTLNAVPPVDNQPHTRPLAMGELIALFSHCCATTRVARVLSLRDRPTPLRASQVASCRTKRWPAAPIAWPAPHTEDSRPPWMQGSPL